MTPDAPCYLCTQVTEHHGGYMLPVICRQCRGMLLDEMVEAEAGCDGALLVEGSD